MDRAHTCSDLRAPPAPPRPAVSASWGAVPMHQAETEKAARVGDLLVAPRNPIVVLGRYLG